MSYTSISTQLASIIDEITAVQAVYEYAPKNPGPFPYVTVEESGNTDIFLSTAANEREYEFMIRVYYPLDDSSACSRIMKSVVDSIISELEGNNTLDGVVSWSLPVTAKWLYTVNAPKPMRVCEITLRAKEVVNR